MKTSPWLSHGRAAALALMLLGSCFAEPTPTSPPDGAAASNEGGDGNESNGGRSNSGRAGREQSDGGGLDLGGVPDFGGNGGEAASSQCAPARPLDASAACRPAETAEPLPMRLIVSAENTSTDSVMFTSDLFGLFKTTCGRCHVENTLKFHTSPNTFPQDIDDEVLGILTSDDPNVFMPPPGSGGKQFSERPPGDPVRRLAELLRIWIDQGKPVSTFLVPAGQGGGGNPYRIPIDTAAAFTNLGSCIPDEGLVGTEFDKMCALDSFFESLQKRPPGEGTLAERIGLPERLDQTDLFTFDTEALARHGVVAFAPAYPLWSDDAGKLRMVRVPLGQSIHYDEETGEFEIPANTRFYKTFFKEVKEMDGVARHRKIETRLIVARPAKELPDGTYEQEALFGSYRWNAAETEATLVTEPLGSNEPFADVVMTLVKDEPQEAEIREKDKDKEYRLASDLEDAGVLRRYAIPGSVRCVQCHMGSSSNSFILGFAPLQINRRKDGEGGVLSPTGRDELTQLDRLIQYGIVTGLKSANEAPKLETSQLPREPRTQYELTAQAYMQGNCGHCHAPHGYPSVTNPALKPLLNFWASKQGGGIFEFPLDRVSPRIKRGPRQDVDVPYITPSLRELWPEDYDREEALGVWTPKGVGVDTFIDAPWRSAIYRNVDTPYTYSDDYGIFPHMPMNTPGYDCRVPRIMAEWMTSIPAKRKEPTVSEDAIRSDARYDANAQPYLEVKKTDSGYFDAVRAGERRVADYQAGSRYSFCPDTRDVQDRNVLQGALVTPIDGELVTQGFPAEGVPDRPHWSPMDLTDTAGDWYPRRGDWQKVLIEHDLGAPPDDGAVAANPRLGLDYEAQKEVVNFLANIKLSELEQFTQFATSRIPFGIWQQKDGCNFANVSKVGDFSGADRPLWMNELSTPSPAREELPVYDTLPGAAIYGMICINCHGAKADSNGRQAATLSDMTGGAARVANFKTGFFGKGGANIARVFGDELVDFYEDSVPDGGVAGTPPGWTGEWPGVPGDWAARYLPWMALGGTKQRIPPAVTNLVAGTEVLGVTRDPPLGAGEVSANMLAVAQKICLATLPLQGVGGQPHPGVENGNISLLELYGGTGLILSNGDRELWDKICYWDNPGPVIALDRSGGLWADGNVHLTVTPGSYFSPAGYPANTPIGDQFGDVADTGPAGEISPENHFRWCVKLPLEPAEEAAARLVTIKGNPLPFCPPGLFDIANKWKTNLDYVSLPDAGSREFRDDFRLWGERGAINAGLAVFLYLKEVLVNGAPPELHYDECERIGTQ